MNRLELFRGYERVSGLPQSQQLGEKIRQFGENIALQNPGVYNTTPQKVNTLLTLPNADPNTLEKSTFFLTYMELPERSFVHISTPPDPYLRLSLAEIVTRTVLEQQDFRLQKIANPTNEGVTTFEIIPSDKGKDQFN